MTLGYLISYIRNLDSHPIESVTPGASEDRNSSNPLVNKVNGPDDDYKNVIQRDVEGRARDAQ